MSHAYPAPAKLNLFLHVVGRRADGYHLLQSVFRLIDRADIVHLTLRDDGRVVREGDLPGVPEDHDLTVRAARLLQSHAPTGAGREYPARQDIADGWRSRRRQFRRRHRAAGARTACGRSICRAKRCSSWPCSWAPTCRCSCSARPRLPRGWAKSSSPVSAPPAWYVVLMPPVQVPTAAIFAAPELTRNTPALKIAPFSAGMGHNDLQSVVVRRYPEVARHLEWLAQFGEARMTGSGACVFASFGTEDAARSVLRQLPETMQGFVAQGLDRHPLYDYCA